MRVAIDSGGTFTDCIAFERGVMKITKVFSTPANPTDAILSAVHQAAPSGVRISVRHGTTVGTNALLERKGAKVAFVTTAGFEDTIAIGRQARPVLYDWFMEAPPCLIPAALRFGVPERTSAEGAILRRPTDRELDDLRESIGKSGAEAIALSLLFSFANSTNERLVAEALKPLGLPLSVSHRILPEFREYERASTVVVNAYLGPKVGSYIHNLQESLIAAYPGAGLHVMQSSGGIISSAVASEEPVRTVLSGPAGGVIGAARIAARAGLSKIIAFDMGGTSTDVSLIDLASEDARTTNESHISGLPIAVPMLDIHTVGAGGGSIAYFDAGGLLHVGPESSGAEPGPICYGKGERPTVTDANLLLGRLDAANFLGGSLQLDQERTRYWTKKVSGPLGSVETFALGTIRLAEAAMEKAIRVISVERGHDPREFTLLSFGGAGPLHACALARSLAIPRVLIPPMPGALSALGILLADHVRDFSRTIMIPYDEVLIKAYFLELEQHGLKAMAQEGLAGRVSRSIDLRYVGQGYEVNVPAGEAVPGRFHSLHRKRYGYADETRAIEIVNLRVRFMVEAEPWEPPALPIKPGDGKEARMKKTSVYFGEEPMEAWVYVRDLLTAGDRFTGPAIITEYSATTVIPPADSVFVDQFGNVIIEVVHA
ncbi:hydantoinase/oxoprolinase family protein [Alloacidobacterium dinghuense]|uniref:Hydantoinase/oxoprolinase family protein n=1 Tax=Alloacidobacterium dinghuense TaxID=2763107 RepID=A0A7G8BJZ3_9BACT|nr:hydantoinase/oxoprolinase family protein [Alloacidobacterium dinghuense]QNI32863.1 hydantoinase/oxoprolinase family protein [Alloacidobacterium dinghuense]